MRKIFHSSAKLIVNESDIDKAFRSMHQSVMTKIKNSVIEERIFNTIVERRVNTFES